MDEEPISASKHVVWLWAKFGNRWVEQRGGISHWTRYRDMQIEVHVFWSFHVSVLHSIRSRWLRYKHQVLNRRPNTYRTSYQYNLRSHHFVHDRGAMVHVAGVLIGSENCIEEVTLRAYASTWGKRVCSNKQTPNSRSTLSDLTQHLCSCLSTSLRSFNARRMSTMLRAIDIVSPWSHR